MPTEASLEQKYEESQERIMIKQMKFKEATAIADMVVRKSQQ